MSKLIGLAFAAMLLLPSADDPVRERYAKYKAIEAYEIRPGILMIPRYSVDGKVCEIGLEKLHYSPKMIRLDSGLSRKEIDQIFEELVPTNERGARSKDFGGSLITRAGQGITTSIDFENVSIQILGQEPSKPSHREIVEDDTVATVHWKGRRCE